MAQAACSDTSSTPEPTAVASANEPGNSAAGLRPTGVPAPAPRSSTEHTASKVLSKHDRTLSDGAQVCDVDFVYAGREPEDVFWEEPCASVTARMVSRSALDALGRWGRLDQYQRRFVADMPGGQVLYVEGNFSASIYPVDETGTSIEVAVAD
ncbi:hypothetical protein C8J45_11340 [Sphingomonas sp. PP-CE-3G-477]|nr:hypothetical protein C8J45_11340 [Sphingomonas sp. PP-CE-3G-477]